MVLKIYKFFHLTFLYFHYLIFSYHFWCFCIFTANISNLQQTIHWKKFSSSFLLRFPFDTFHDSGKISRKKYFLLFTGHSCTTSVFHLLVLFSVVSKCFEGVSVVISIISYRCFFNAMSPVSLWSSHQLYFRNANHNFVSLCCGIRPKILQK